MARFRRGGGLQVGGHRTLVTVTSVLGESASASRYNSRPLIVESRKKGDDGRCYPHPDACGAILRLIQAINPADIGAR